MPAGVVKTKAQEEAWTRAKAQARKTYAALWRKARDGDKTASRRFYGIVMHIFQRMAKSAASKTVLGKVLDGAKA